MKKTCRFVLVPATDTNEACYCNKPVSYKLVENDDKQKVRKYNSFCPEHQAIVDQQDEEDLYV